MKTTKLLLTLLAILSLSVSCSGQSEKNNETANDASNEEVKVYYSHMTRRCATCKAVEAQSRKAVKSLYPEKYEAGKISFTAFNVEKDKNQDLANKIGVNSQKLLIVGGEQKIDITRQGFMYARSKPEKLKSIIKEKVDPLLE